MCPSPPNQITLEEINMLNRLLSRHGASNEERNTVRKNIEILKGGGLALRAKPAMVCFLFKKY